MTKPRRIIPAHNDKGTPETRWYVVHTLVRREGLANTSLKHLGCETLYIRQRRKMRFRNATEVRLCPYFPRYVFASVPGHVSLYSINKAPGVATVLYNDSGPFTIAQPAIDDMLARTDTAGVTWDDDADEYGELHDTTVGHLGRAYAIGEAVRVKFGPFLDQVGEVLHDKGSAVLVMFGALPVTLPYACLEPAA